MIEVPGYYLKRTIGSGGMATVYLAVQESLEREVALKVMSPVLSADVTFATRFRREARTIARLSHSNIVQIFDVGTTEDNHNYISMQYLSGGTLKDRFDKRFEEMELLRIVTGVLHALGFAHDLGFVHRDVKPENVLFDPSDQPILTDFGIARALRSSTRITQTGMSVGTGRYMSPEQARGNPVDARSDLYSMGVVLYEALTGTVPFDSEDTFAVAYAHVNEPLPPLPEYCKDWQPIVARVMAKEPKERYPSAQAMIAAMEALARRHRESGVIDTRAGAMGLTRMFGQRRSHRAWWQFWKGQGKPAITEHSMIPLAIPSAFSRRALARVRPWLPRFLQRPVWRTVQVIDQAFSRLRKRFKRLKGGKRPFGWIGAAAVVLLAAGWWFWSGAGVNRTQGPVAASSERAVAGTEGAKTKQQATPVQSLEPASPQASDTIAVNAPDTQQPEASSATPLAQVAAQGTSATRESADIPKESSPPAEVAEESAELSMIPPWEKSANPAQDLAENTSSTSQGDAAIDPPQTIPELLEAGDRAVANLALTTPPGNNALSYFTRVLAMDPDNSQARAGLVKIVETYLALVEGSLNEERAEEAARYLLRAREVATQHQLNGRLALAMELAQQETFRQLMTLGREAAGSQDESLAKEFFNLAASLVPGSDQPAQALAALSQDTRVARLFSDTLAIGGQGPEMATIPAGAFRMGNQNTGTATVTIERPFAMSRKEITVSEFRRFVEATDYKTNDEDCEVFQGSWWEGGNYGWLSPGFAQLGNHPVVCVRWDDAQAYVNWLTVQTGRSYRLPSEAEWEYALVTGGGLADVVCTQGNVGDQWLKNHFPREEAFECADGIAFTAPVGSWPPNNYGLYDLVGNAREWVLDCWHENHQGRPTDQSAWLTGRCDERVIKGSSWVTGRPDISPAHRLSAPTDESYNAVGFRVVRAVE